MGRRLIGRIAIVAVLSGALSAGTATVGFGETSTTICPQNMGINGMLTGTINGDLVVDPDKGAEICFLYGATVRGDVWVKSGGNLISGVTYNLSETEDNNPFGGGNNKSFLPRGCGSDCAYNTKKVWIRGSLHGDQAGQFQINNTKVSGNIDLKGTKTGHNHKNVICDTWVGGEIRITDSHVGSLFFVGDDPPEYQANPVDEYGQDDATLYSFFCLGGNTIKGNVEFTRNLDSMTLSDNKVAGRVVVLDGGHCGSGECDEPAEEMELDLAGNDVNGKVIVNNNMVYGDCNSTADAAPKPKTTKHTAFKFPGPCGNPNDNENLDLSENGIGGNLDCWNNQVQGFIDTFDTSVGGTRHGQCSKVQD